MTTLRGRWAQGLEPRMFSWIIKDRLAASERPGGFARNHRKIRRQEELIWLAQNGFTRVISLLDSPHNLHAYGEAGIACEHVPIGRHDELGDRLPSIYESIARRLDVPEERLLVHHEISLLSFDIARRQITPDVNASDFFGQHWRGRVTAPVRDK